MALQSILAQALIQSVNQHHSQLLGKRIWLACSGGRDSMSLAKVCHQLFHDELLPFLPQLLHVNHGMQIANDSWATEVQAWARKHNMTCQVLHIFLDEKTEQAARKARYAAMIDVMNCEDVLMLGHHMDDQVETVLMRLFNGAGVNGLRGMSDWTAKHPEVACSKDTCSKMIYLWRPWLSVSRAQITQYAIDRQLAYIDDPTNIIHKPQSQSLVRKIEIAANAQKSINNSQPVSNSSDLNSNDRAWLRSVLMPIIKERYPQATDAIHRTSQLMQEAGAIVNQKAKDDLGNLSMDTSLNQSVVNLCAVINIKRLLSLPKPRQSTAIHAWLHPIASELPPSKRLVNDVLALCERDDANHQTSLHWNSGLYRYDIRRYQDSLYRLRQDWLAWLQIPPDTQQLTLSSLQNNFNSPLDDDTLPLKSYQSHIIWKMKGLKQLAESLPMTHLTTDMLQLEPLPRDLKVTLKGRVGRKSGKKLLQALNQPSFMRSSIVLLSIISNSGSSNDILSNSDDKVPLAIICLDNIYLLENDISQDLSKLINCDVVSTMVCIDD